MTQYIDKSTLVAEIKKRLKEYQESADAYYIPAKRELKEILSFIDTLEVKGESKKDCEISCPNFDEAQGTPITRGL